MHITKDKTNKQYIEMSVEDAVELIQKLAEGIEHSLKYNTDSFSKGVIMTETIDGKEHHFGGEVCFAILKEMK